RDTGAATAPAPAAPVAAPAVPAPVIPAPAPLPTPQELHQQAEKALQDVAGQVDTAVKAMFAPHGQPAPPQG
ncbi:alpha/beta hydrolase, partial [Dietzia sp. CQ4]|nr:alpha/beta hydrolase [Dietzia sp. CQ4]